MGATDDSQQCAETDSKALFKKTEQLFKWISQMRQKKIQYLRCRHRNIRVEATLGHALFEAEKELRNKHIDRINRMEASRVDAVEAKKKKTRRKKSKNRNNRNNNNENDNSTVYTACMYEKLKPGQPAPEVNFDNLLKQNSEIWPELNSLDKFMDEIGLIKTPLER